METSNANYLLVFLGIFLGLVGSYFWKIIAFLLYQAIAGKEPGDGMHHQTLLILRNASSPSGAAWALAKLAGHWRAIETGSRLIPTLLLSIIPFAIAAGFAAAGIESTKVTAGDAHANEVLISPTNCGARLWTPDLTTFANEISFATWLAETGRLAKAYVQTCYGNSSSQLGLSDCSSYPVSQIPYAVSTNSPCPFNETMCILGPDTAFQMDTGFFDSHQVLGINAPSSDRVSIRKLATCSVLQDKLYLKASNITESDGSTHYAYDTLYFGPYLPDNYTYQYTDSAADDGFGYNVMQVFPTSTFL